MSVPAVLVIGASGAIGSRLVDELVPDHRAGLLRVVAATRQQQVASSLRERGIEVRRLDLDDAELGGLGAVQPVFEGIDRVFLLTGYDVRMLARSKAAIDAASAAGVSHLVHLGSSSDAKTTIEYAGWHKLIEAYVERSGIGYTHLWPSAFMQVLPLTVAAPGVLSYGIGDASVNWVDVGDIAAVAATVLRDPQPHQGLAYHLAAESASFTDLAGQLADTTGRSWRYEPGKPEVFYEQLVAAGYDPVYMRGVRNYLRRIGDGSLTDPTGIYDTIETVTGRPATSLRQFLERHGDDFLR